MVGSTKFEATASGICTSCELDESQDSPFVRKDFFQIFEDPDRRPPVQWPGWMNLGQEAITSHRFWQLQTVLAQQLCRLILAKPSMSMSLAASS